MPVCLSRLQPAWLTGFSLVQLNKLSGLKKLRGQDMRKVTVEDFLKRTRSLQDPEILGVVSASGLICAIKA
jgi:hypothetical protein